jgi:uncharacterized protein (DUF924 family)
VIAGERSAGAALSSVADVVAYWRALGPDRWFAKNDDTDAEIRDKFRALHAAAANGLLGDWDDNPEGALALLIVLDQFPRNMFRGSPAAFSTDPLARAAAARAIARGFDLRIAPAERIFFYLPFMHSEDVADQERCCELCRVLGNEEQIDYAKKHADIIRRFGRFPHRNTALGRATTTEEQAFLDDGGFAG